MFCTTFGIELMFCLFDITPRSVTTILSKEKGKMSRKEVYFVAGSYGVGKSTLCKKVSRSASIPEYSASELISGSVGENYGPNKVVEDKHKNQYALINAVKTILRTESKIILSGHFCIFDKRRNVDILPEFVYKHLSINKIILLEAEPETVCSNLKLRDGKDYSVNSILALKECERHRAQHITELISAKLYVHQMTFDNLDLEYFLSYMRD